MPRDVFLFCRKYWYRYLPNLYTTAFESAIAAADELRNRTTLFSCTGGETRGEFAAIFLTAAPARSRYFLTVQSYVRVVCPFRNSPFHFQRSLNIEFLFLFFLFLREFFSPRYTPAVFGQLGWFSEIAQFSYARAETGHRVTNARRMCLLVSISSPSIKCARSERVILHSDEYARCFFFFFRNIIRFLLSEIGSQRSPPRPVVSCL